MIRLTPIDVPGHRPGQTRIIDCDLDPGSRSVAILKADGTRHLVAGQGELALPLAAAARIGTARLLPDDRVLVEPIGDITDAAMDVCAIVSATGCNAAPIGVPHRLFTGGGFTFVTYGERTLLFTREPSFEGDIVTVFDSATHHRQFGLAELMTGQRSEPDAYEVTCGCVSHTGVFCFVADGLGCLRTIDAVRRAWHAVQPEAAFDNADDVAALAIDGADAVLLVVRADGLELAWVDRRSGACRRREHLPATVLAEHIADPITPKPASGWWLHAEVRGLEGGRFLLRTADVVLLLQTDPAWTPTPPPP